MNETRGEKETRRLYDNEALKSNERREIGHFGPERPDD